MFESLIDACSIVHWAFALLKTNKVSRKKENKIFFMIDSLRFND
jgi:hypothetical protein